MDDKKTNDYRFVNETTKKIPPNWKQFGTKLGIVVFFAAVFGAVACLVFSLLKPAVEGRIMKHNISLDDSSQEAEEEPEQIVIQENKEMTLEDYEQLENQLYSVGKDARKSVVEIVSVTSEKDWFDSDYESSGQGAGIIVADTANEYLILTERNLVSEAKKLQVQFYGDHVASARIKAFDANTGIAVLSVDKRELESDTLKQITALKIGSSSALVSGDLAVAVGSPQGDAGSVLTGRITSVNKRISTSDINFKVLTTDMEIPSTAGGVLLNTKGELIGLITHLYNPGESRTQLMALPFSEITELVEKLSNGKSIPYLGIRFSEVTQQISGDYDLPEGIYIKSVDLDSPAMTAGLQAGDILVEMNGQEILTESAFTKALWETKEDQEVKLIVKRLGSGNAYQSVSCEAVIGRMK
ncbi:Probable periplasmic serine endoprotease DegP-like precursor [uncultured Roseburia sp.]|uniref:S1C family serine protease n=1 Tax=Brotonthovivens ammoniilytica TaxID=2981725 RepID=A0ABT2TJ71_9FIRM|nr:S1C family serine protease [Brotonthovivens ammoniilytica]MCU6762260.1 S1C family serine protease [Brotonthovivens ammoniilytica]SCI60495.1 Probable periplasmic serine endoprotease DegP-like precursor [uncultured Roseburia sp.]